MFPTGVELHKGKIRIMFIYRGVRCREVLHGWTVTASNIKKAGNLRAAIICDIQLGQFDYAERFPDSKAISKFTTTKRLTTFKELCDFFLSAKTLEVSNASLYTATSIVNTLRRIIGDNTQLVDIQHSDLLRYRHELLTGEVINPIMPNIRKKGRTPSTVNTRMSLLFEMLKLAHRSKFIPHAPYEGVSLLTLSKRDPDPLLLHEYQSMIAALSGQTALVWILAVHTGMRHGELCALAWEDIDLEKGEIHVSRNLTNKKLFVPPKTNAGFRTITLLKPAHEALKEQFKLTGSLPKREITYHHREHGKTETQHLKFVFVPLTRSKAKVGYYSRNSISHGWKKGVEISGVRPRHPYQSRHTYACWSLSAGANPSFIASQMGHENAKMVYEVYGKWIGEMDKDQIGMLNDKIQTALPPSRPPANKKRLKVV